MAWIELATNQLGIWDIPDSPEALNNAQIIWDFFKGMLFSDESIAGILGNMAQESMLNPHQFGYNASMTDPYTPRGLIMWTTQANIQNMYNYMNDNGFLWYDGTAQLLYIYDNPNNQVFSPNPNKGYTYPWGNGEGEFGSITSVVEATNAFCWQAERPSSPQLDDRIRFAQFYYDTFHGYIPPLPERVSKMAVWMMISRIPF